MHYNAQLYSIPFESMKLYVNLNNNLIRAIQKTVSKI